MNIPSEVERLLDVPLHFEASLPMPMLRVSELLALSVGSLIRTSRCSGETVDIFANGALIGVAELSEANGRRAARMVRFGPGSR